MSLKELRTQLAKDTLNEVSNILDEIIHIRYQDSVFDLEFESKIQHSSFKIYFNVKGGTVTEGSYLETDYQQDSITRYQLSNFPILFLHQVAILALRMKQRASYITVKDVFYNMDTITQLIASGNEMIAILSDPKFTEITFEHNLKQSLNVTIPLTLIYKDSSFSVKIRDSEIPNKESPLSMKELGMKLKRIVSRLDYLRSDVCTWKIDNTEI